MGVGNRGPWPTGFSKRLNSAIFLVIFPLAPPPENFSADALVYVCSFFSTVA